MTLQEVLNKYDKAAEFFLSEMKAKGKSDRTVFNYRNRIDYFRRFFEETHRGEEDVAEPGFLDFQMWRDSLIEKGMKNGTVGQYLKELKIFFGYMSDDALCECKVFDRNPVSKRVIPSDRSNKKKYEQLLTDEDVLKLWNSEPPERKGKKCTKAHWVRNYAMTILLLTTEIRNSELSDLRLTDLDFEYGEITVRHGKGDKARSVEFPKLAQTAVRMYLRDGDRPKDCPDDDYLFGSFYSNERFGGNAGKNAMPWHRLTINGVSELVRKHVKSVTGVDHIRSHDLRHVGARLDLHNGMEPIELQSKLGHESFNTTQIYCGKLGTARHRQSAERVFRERDRQAKANERMLGA